MRWSTPALWLSCAALSGVGLLGLGERTDPATLEALWAFAQATAPDELAAPAWLDVAEHCERTRPWQGDHARCRALLQAIDRARAPR